jgi:hypothetical protein
MTVDPFIAGIFCTIAGECIIVVFVALFTTWRK